MKLQNNYIEFKNMIDEVASDYMEEFKDKKCCISYSGGIDSTLILASLISNPNCINDLTIVHKYFNLEDKYRNFLYKISSFISKKVKLPLVFFERKDLNTNFFGEYRQMDYDVVFCGVGLDSCYYGFRPDIKYKFPSYGERFKGRHPYLDFLLTLHNRVLNYRHIKYNFPMSAKVRNNIPDIKELINFNNDNNGIKFICYPMHEKFISYFSNYKPNLRDMFINKSFSQRYIKDKLGLYPREIYRIVLNE